MHTSARSAAGDRQQRGWVGILAMLLVVALVAIMAGTLLRQYGLAGGSPASAGKGARGGSAASELVGGVAPAAAPDTVTPAPRDAINRARGLEEAVRQQAADLDKRIDEGTK